MCVCVCVCVFAPVDLFACLLTVLCIVCIAMRINILIYFRNKFLSHSTGRKMFKSISCCFTVIYLLHEKLRREVSVPGMQPWSSRRKLSWNRCPCDTSHRIVIGHCLQNVRLSLQLATHSLRTISLLCNGHLAKFFHCWNLFTSYLITWTDTDKLTTANGGTFTSSSASRSRQSR